MKELQKKVQKMMDWLESQEIHSEEQVQEKLKKVLRELKNNDDAADDVFEKFAEVCERLEAMRESKRTLEADQVNLIDKNRDKKRAWIKTVEMLVGKINDRFLEFFRKINCEGRIQFGPVPKELLDCTFNNPETEYHDEDDFRNYGILIFVKFRKTQALQLLSPTQSGGERSVSTMLYLLSMQEVTRAPFRLIDEINQGMDNRNERMVMECLADIASEGLKTQYFILTPKLLKDLPYNKQMTLNVTHNGGKYALKRDYSGQRFKNHRIDFNLAIESQKFINEQQIERPGQTSATQQAILLTQG